MVDLIFQFFRYQIQYSIYPLLGQEGVRENCPRIALFKLIKSSSMQRSKNWNHKDYSAKTLMSRIECKCCSIGMSYLAGLFDIFTLLHI